jgi:3-deoxy-D-manno-octulosonic acid kinase
LSPDDLDQLIGAIEQPTQSAAAVLGGRTSVSKIHLNGLGAMVIKHYRRGGWMRQFVENKYLRWGKPRCGAEFDMLLQVRRLGVHAPEPIAYASLGRLLYRCWLVTREIPVQSSLAELSRSDPQAALKMMPSVAVQIARLIAHGIWHVDLHPGNVLIDAHGKIHLIDFDRARENISERIRLRRRYLKRWERAVSKHRLPPQLTQQLETGLSA